QREPATPGTKPQRQLNAEDLRRAIDELAQLPHPVETLPPQASSTALRKQPRKRRKRIKTILH
ncbi:ISNCY family transposase, partial [Cupriavidus basilensis]|nr:ISNCY family transposase [Cupriavidus basilensis]